MKLIAFTVAAACAAVSHAQTLEASSVWSSGPGANGHGYALYSASGGITWDAAQAYAGSIGGYLATPTSSAENTFIYMSLGIAGNNNVWFLDGGSNNQIGPWLGGFQPAGSSEPAGGWQWVTGEAWSYTTWSPGEPNNTAGLENRLHFLGNNATRNSNWNDAAQSSAIRGFVVEFVVPSPGAAALLGCAALGTLRRRR